MVFRNSSFEHFSMGVLKRLGLLGEGSAKKGTLDNEGLAEGESSKSSSTTSDIDGASSSSGGSDDKSGSRGSEDGADKAEKGKAEHKFSFHLK